MEKLEREQCLAPILLKHTYIMLDAQQAYAALLYFDKFMTGEQRPKFFLANMTGRQRCTLRCVALACAFLSLKFWGSDERGLRVFHMTRVMPVAQSEVLALEQEVAVALDYRLHIRMPVFCEDGPKTDEEFWACELTWFTLAILHLKLSLSPTKPSEYALDIYKYFMSSDKIWQLPQEWFVLICDFVSFYSRHYTYANNSSHVFHLLAKIVDPPPD